MENISACTTYPNTPETDMQRFVMHTVKYTDKNGEWKSLKIMASDPSDAIRKLKEVYSEK
jgi:hypothetical protein|tara:strand:+ start:740 stop:919 length:180 start_codon:yes stop_codon:yes gene_type:complete